jgi:ubiquinone/menaquinone biosynthesis C-methylase UbiE
MGFEHVSYKKHSESFEADLLDEQRIARARTWFEKDTANQWRHRRMYEAVDLLQAPADSSWLTVGDGRFGLDAITLREAGFTHVLPTDIAETLLRKSQAEGRLEKYAVENAESLSFETRQFDYVFCKESYHHFPRPALALYEMLRVARKAVVLIEPNDPAAVFIPRLKHAIKNVLGHAHMDAHYYEESGNYIYSISRREMEKVALGLNLPLMAFKGINDHYIDGCEFERASWTNPTYARIRTKCALKDLFARTFLYDYNLLMVIFFKEAPHQQSIASLKRRRWKVVSLPRNPYAQEFSEG